MHPFLDNTFLFNWSQLTPAHMEPDIREALRRATVAVDAVKSLKGGDLTYKNVLLGLESATRDLSRAWGLVSHLDAVLNSDELRKAYNALLPDVTAFFTAMTLDAQLWSVLKTQPQS